MVTNMNIDLFLKVLRGKNEPTTLESLSFVDLKTIIKDIDEYYEALDELNPHPYTVELLMHPDTSGGVYLRNMQTEKTKLLFSFDEVK
jgi:hypothetical protein